MSSDRIERLYEAFLEGDRSGAKTMTTGWALEIGYRAQLETILQPALDRFGDVWASQEDLSLAQGDMSGKIAEDILLAMVEAEGSNADRPEPRGVAVIGNIEDDYHALGRRLVGIFLEVAAWSSLPVEIVRINLDELSKGLEFAREEVLA